MTLKYTDTSHPLSSIAQGAIHTMICEYISEGAAGENPRDAFVPAEESRFVVWSFRSEQEPASFASGQTSASKAAVSKWSLTAWLGMFGRQGMRLRCASAAPCRCANRHHRHTLPATRNNLGALEICGRDFVEAKCLIERFHRKALGHFPNTPKRRSLERSLAHRTRWTCTCSRWVGRAAATTARTRRMR